MCEPVSEHTSISARGDLLAFVQRRGPPSRQSSVSQDCTIHCTVSCFHVVWWFMYMRSICKCTHIHHGHKHICHCQAVPAQGPNATAAADSLVSMSSSSGTAQDTCCLEACSVNLQSGCQTPNRRAADSCLPCSQHPMGIPCFCWEHSCGTG